MQQYSGKSRRQASQPSANCSEPKYKPAPLLRFLRCLLASLPSRSAGNRPYLVPCFLSLLTPEYNTIDQFVSSLLPSDMAHVFNGNPSPANSNSPTSPRLSHRQLRPPKGPLYVPAALRPTERHPKHSPPTPPRSVHGSLDSLDGDNNNNHNHDNDNDNMNESISRRSTMESDTGGIAKMAVNEWMKNEDLGQVTGHPKRDHWKVGLRP